MEKNQTWAFPTYLSLMIPEPHIRLPIVRTIEKWVECSGEEWTVDRLKTLKAWRIYTEHTATACPEFFKTCSTRGVTAPKGAFRPLWNMKVQTAVDILNVYQTFVSLQATEAQKRKFYTGVRHVSSGDGIGTSNPLGARGSYHSECVIRGFKKQGLTAYLGKWTSSNKRCPVLTEDGPRTKPEDEASYQEHMRYFFQFAENDHLIPVLKEHMGLQPMEKGFLGLAPMMLPSARMFPMFSPNTGWYSVPTLVNPGLPFHVGRISYIQEPGYKLRAIANPARIWQSMLGNLGGVLYGLLSTVEEDCTFDQVKGVHKVQEWIRKGDTVYCVDLTDATSTFPRDYTLKVLRNLLGPEWEPDIQVFEHIASSPWLTPEGDYVTFTSGQPLGSYPSFAAFALSHHSLVRSLESSPEYVILGDDIVIRGEEGGQQYLDALDKLGVPISEKKTIASSKIAEFAGCVISPSWVMYPKKWRPLTRENFLDIAQNFGPRVVSLMPKYYQYLVSLVKELPEPYGLGWNPRGKTWLERVGTLFDLYTKPSILPISEDAGMSLVSKRDIVAFKESLTLGFPATYVIGASATSTNDQFVDPVLSLLMRLASQNFPIGGNINAIQGDWKVTSAPTWKVLNPYIVRVPVERVVTSHSEQMKFILKFLHSGYSRSRPSTSLTKRVRRMMRGYRPC